MRKQPRAYSSILLFFAIRAFSARRALFAATVLVFSVALFSCSADFSFGGSVSEALAEDLTSRYVFYALNPDDDSETEYVEKAFSIGSTLDMTTLSFSDISNLRTGYTFTGWKYYRNPVTLSTEVPDTCTVDEDELVTAITVTPSPESFVAVWTLSYDDYGTVSVTIVSSDIGITSTTGSTAVILQADSGYESYSWFIDGKEATEAVSGTSQESETLTIPTASLVSGYVYQVTVVAVKNGITYSAQVQVEVSE